jgi:hypothetical protein
MRLPRFPRAFYVPKGAVKVSDKQSTAIAYLYDGAKSGRPGAVAFSGKADKPAFNYTFRLLINRDNAVRDFFANVRAREKSRIDQREKRKAFVHTAQVGDIYRTSWGYDQTNVEFFEIVEIQGKYAILREIQSASIDRGMGSESCVPQSGAYLKPRFEGDDQGEPIRRLIQQSYIKICDVRHAWPWGKRGPGGIVIGDAATRTAFGWGH